MTAHTISLRETIKERLPLMQAWCDGKPVQARYFIVPGEWRDCIDPPWLDLTVEIRLKPEPREFWIAKRQACLSTSNVYVSNNKRVAEEVADRHGVEWEVIHVREVLP